MWSLKRLIIGISQIITLVTMVIKVRRVIYISKVAKLLKVPKPSNLCPSTNIHAYLLYLLIGQCTDVLMQPWNQPHVGFLSYDWMIHLSLISLGHKELKDHFVARNSPQALYQTHQHL